MQDKKISSENLTENELKTRLQHLSEENERLAREVTELKNELREYKGKSAWHSRDDKYQHALRHRADTEYMFSKNNYASFLFAQLKCTSFFQIYKRAVNAFRKYSFITTSLKVFSIIFLFVEASILVLVSTSAFIASLVFTFFLSHLFTLFTILSRRKCNKINEELLKGKDVTVFFPPKERAFEESSYFCGFVREEARSDNAVVIIVSPYIFKSTGLEMSKKSYIFCRNDGERVMLVRRRYYFTLRKKIIDKMAVSVKEIY